MYRTRYKGGQLNYKPEHPTHISEVCSFSFTLSLVMVFIYLEYDQLLHFLRTGLITLTHYLQVSSCRAIRLSVRY
jgi:hypothetical protein